MSYQPPKNTSSDDEGGQPPEAIRSVITLVLFFHLFCAFALLVVGQVPVDREDGVLLAQRLGRTLSFYGQLLNFETPARYYLTHATPDEEDHRLEYLPPGASPTDPSAWVLMTRGVRGTTPYLRNQTLADTIAFFAEPERNAEDSAAFVASSVGRYLHNQAGIKAQQLRVLKHSLQEMRVYSETEVFRRDPNDPSYFREVYRAQILDFGNGEVRVQKVEDKGQVAPATRGPKQ